MTPGDTVDFWRVEAVEPNRLLRLAAEMRLPGRAWLQFEVTPENGGSLVRQTALFDPVGLSGLAALGPNMLALARDRASGAYPYLVTPSYVADARATFRGPTQTSPEVARSIPVSTRRSEDFPLPDGPARQDAPSGSEAVRSRSTSLPSRDIVTRSSSKSTP